MTYLLSVETSLMGKSRQRWRFKNIKRISRGFSDTKKENILLMNKRAVGKARGKIISQWFTRKSIRQES